jgi:hypothetical protein
MQKQLGIRKRIREHTGIRVNLTKRIRPASVRDDAVAFDPTHPIHSHETDKHMTGQAYSTLGSHVLASFMRGAVITPNALNTLAKFGKIQGTRLMVKIIQMPQGIYNDPTINGYIQETHGDFANQAANIVYRPFDYFNRPRYWNILLTTLDGKRPALWRDITALRDHNWTTDEVESANSEGWFDIWSASTAYINTGIIFLALNPPKAARGARPNSDVGAFTFVSTSHLNLRFAQIYRDAELEEHRKERITQCLLFALTQAGMSEEIVRGVAVTCLQSGTRFVSMVDLKKVSTYIGRPFAISRVNKNGGGNFRILRRIINPKISQEEPIELGLLESHIFHNRQIMTNKEEIKASISGPTHNLVLSASRYSKPAIWVIHTLQRMNTFLPFTSEQLSRGAPEDDDFQETADVLHMGVRNLTPATVERDQRLYEHKDKKKKDQYFFAADCESYTHNGSSNHELCMIGITLIENPSNWQSQEIKTWTSSQHPVESMLSYIHSKVYAERMMEISEDEDDDEKYDYTEAFKDQEEAITSGYISNKRRNHRGKLVAVVYFHNLRYDRAVLQEHLRPFDILESDNSIYFMKIMFKDIIIEFRDSFKHMSMGIKSMAKAFDLPSGISKKEMGVAYDYYNRDNLYKETSVDFYMFSMRTQVDRTEFVELLRAIPEAKLRWDEDSESEVFCPWGFYRYYLYFDVLSLSAALYKYSVCGKALATDYIEDIEDIETFNPLAFLTKSSFSRYLSSSGGTFENSFEYCGLLRSFIMQSLRGGRVCGHPEFIGRQIEANDSGILYFDGVSLYPSAIRLFCEEQGGFPTGKARLLPRRPVLTDPKYKYYVVTIRITAIPKKMVYSIPIIALHNKKTSSVDYIQDLPDGKAFYVTVGKVDLEDYIKFHNIEFTVIEGVYWSSSSPPNKTWGDMMNFLFNSRLAYKDQKNTSMSNMIKLAMNSQYGSTIVKTHDTKHTLLDKSRPDLNQAVYNIFHSIVEMYDIGQVLQVKRAQVDMSFNSCLFGTIVVSMARRIMNRVMWSMEHTQTYCLYTDTDSLMFDAGKLDDITVHYEAEFKSKLVGTQLGQFHSDFESIPGCADSTVRSAKLYLVAKKIYCHELYGYNTQGEMIESRQFKCKGIPKKAMEAKALTMNPDLNMGISELYALLTPEEADISDSESDEEEGGIIESPDEKSRGISILCNPDSARFIYTKNKGVSTPYDNFYRRIKRKALRGLTSATLKKL